MSLFISSEHMNTVSHSQPLDTFLSNKRLDRYTIKDDHQTHVSSSLSIAYLILSSAEILTGVCLELCGWRVVTMASWTLQLSTQGGHCTVGMGDTGDLPALHHQQLQQQQQQQQPQQQPDLIQVERHGLLSANGSSPNLDIAFSELRPLTGRRTNH